MAYTVRPMMATDARLIAHWHYPEPYGFYDLDRDPKDYQELLDFESWPPNTRFSVTDPDGELIGFFKFATSDGITDIGLGLRPDKSGMGLGQQFLQIGLSFALGRFHPRQFRLKVAAFNQRAITVYERAGFKTTRMFKQKTNGALYDFIEMQSDLKNLLALPGSSEGARS